MREKERRHQTQKLGFAYSRTFRSALAAVHRAGLLDFVSYIFVDGGGPGTRNAYITDTEFANNITITVFSFGIFGVGLGQIITELIGH